MNDAAFDEALEDRLGVRIGDGTWGCWSGLGFGTSCAAVHGLIGEAVGMLVLGAQGVLDDEGIEALDTAAGLGVEGDEVGTLDLEASLDLLDHQLGVGDDA